MMRLPKLPFWYGCNPCLSASCLENSLHDWISHQICFIFLRCGLVMGCLTPTPTCSLSVELGKWVHTYLDSKGSSSLLFTSLCLAYKSIVSISLLEQSVWSSVYTYIIVLKMWARTVPFELRLCRYATKMEVVHVSRRALWTDYRALS